MEAGGEEDPEGRGARAVKLHVGWPHMSSKGVGG
jgi:hypothetical protein